MKLNRVLILGAVLLALLSLGQTSLAHEDDGSARIRVHKFHDDDRDARQDRGERDIEGWLIRLYVLDYDSWSLELIDHGYTNSTGDVIFDGLTPGATYKVWEEDRDCWEPGALWDVGTAPALPGGYIKRAKPTATETEVVSFGNVYTCELLCETELLAGQHWNAGTLSITDDGKELTVKFDTTGTDWSLGETHLYVGTEPPKKSAPGRFPYKYQTEYTISLNEFGSETLYIAGHAEVTRGDQEETAWADSYGVPIRKRGGWAMYFGYEVGSGCFEP